MNEKRTIKFLSLVSYIGFWLCCALMVLLTGLFIFMLFNGDSSAYPRAARAFMESQHQISLTIVTTIVLYIVLILRAFILLLIYKMLHEFSHEHFFTVMNLHYLRRCTHSFAGLVGADGILLIIWEFFRFQIGISHGQSIITELLAWFAVYTVYIIFRKGLTFKTENEDFV